ncbi:VOC family protein [Blastococcus sp. Marseille-P5729]|uniref:VOC family protein n=1 Tax=Blastococcus sp. Marseille-P5729 TaxID=2086582 RepID=UPI000D10D48D|nr:VOC family protein [Blastococcus sp. Marseille-P5729]
MKITKTTIAFDAADMQAESTFWASLLDGRIEPFDDDWINIVIGDGSWVVAVQHAPDHRPPTWPANDVPQQIHIDLYVDDIHASHEEVLRLGARPLQDADLDAAEGWAVYADPAGHPFCLCWE